MLGHVLDPGLPVTLVLLQFLELRLPRLAARQGSTDSFQVLAGYEATKRLGTAPARLGRAVGYGECDRGRLMRLYGCPSG